MSRLISNGQEQPWIGGLDEKIKLPFDYTVHDISLQRALFTF